MNRRRTSHLFSLWLVIAAGCTPSTSRPASPTWTGPLLTAPAQVEDGAFAPSPALQFLVDPYPSPRGPSWLGADVATSIRVTGDHYIWIFGDTLLGSVSNQCPNAKTYCDRLVDRAPTPGLIRNSVGIAKRAGPGSFHRVVKEWPTSDQIPHPPFSVQRGEGFLWPLSGVRAGEPVFLAANIHTPQSGLAPVGNVMIRIANPEDEPERWQLSYHELPHFRPGDQDSPALVWTMALVHLDQRVYVFGGLGQGFDVRTVLARLRVEDMAAPTWTPRPEYLMRNEKGDLHWGENFDIDRLHHIRGLPGTSETTVHHSPALGWYSYQLTPLDFDIRLFTAPDLEGPWRDSGVVYRIPQPWSTSQRENCTPAGPTCAAYIAYAVKAHPELAPAGGQALSYNVNVASGQLLAAEQAAENVHGFYVPQMLLGPARGFRDPKSAAIP